MSADQPPAIPPQIPSPAPRRFNHDDDNQRLTLHWKILLVVVLIGFCALIARLIYAHSIVKESDAIKADITTVAKIDKRLKELKYRLRIARNPQERSEAQYLILAEIKALPTKLSDYSRDQYENMRVISGPLHEATLDYNKKATAFFGPNGKWVAPFTAPRERLAEARSQLKTLAEENTRLRTLYQERISALTRAEQSDKNNSSLLNLLRLSESKKSAYNLIRDSDAKIYETMDAILQLMDAECGQWEYYQPPYLRWKTQDLARQSDEFFDELALLYQQQRDAQLELLDLTWNG